MPHIGRVQLASD